MPFMPFCRSARFTLLAAFVAAPTLPAQQVDSVLRGPRLRLGAATGLARTPASPRGGSTLGYHVAGLLELASPWRPLRLRADVTSLDAGPDQVYGVSLGAVAVLPLPRAQPYLLGSVGNYWGDPASDRAGVNGFALGAGLRFPLGGRTGFLETRVHNYRASVMEPGGPPRPEERRNFLVPFSAGVLF